jgi:hypothetical protein
MVGSNIGGPVPQSNTGQNTMTTATHQSQHPGRIVAVKRFAYFLTVAFGNRVGRHDQSMVDQRCHRLSFAIGRPADIFLGGARGTNPLFYQWIYRYDLEFQSCLLHQMLPSRRLAGQD